MWSCFLQPLPFSPHPTPNPDWARSKRLTGSKMGWGFLSCELDIEVVVREYFNWKFECLASAKWPFFGAMYIPKQRKLFGRSKVRKKGTWREASQEAGLPLPGSGHTWGPTLTPVLESNFPSSLDSSGRFLYLVLKDKKELFSPHLIHDTTEDEKG